MVDYEWVLTRIKEVDERNRREILYRSLFDDYFKNLREVFVINLNKVNDILEREGKSKIVYASSNEELQIQVDIHGDKHTCRLFADLQNKEIRVDFIPTFDPSILLESLHYSVQMVSQKDEVIVLDGTSRIAPYDISKRILLTLIDWPA